MKILVHTPFGRMEGTAADGVHCFAGVPFAKPPLGRLRFRAPELADPWTGIFSATRYAKDPIQNHQQHGPECYSEDCLYLNIWVPQTGEHPLPVMVWVPGGAFATGGSGALAPEGPSVYECSALARETGCIIVSVSYRLNALGFLNLGAFSDRFDDHIGIKDLIMALRWVHTAIESFGGDASNVTLFGESAGAGAISALLLIDEAQPYFHKALMQSNCFDSFYTAEESDEICAFYLEHAGLSRTTADALPDLSHKQLLDAGTALDAYVAEHYLGRCSFCPVVDGVFLKDFPTLAHFESMKKPVLVGSNRSEGNLQSAFLWTDPVKYAPLALRRLSDSQRGALLSSYPGLPSQAAFGELLTDLMYAFPKIRFAEHLSRENGAVYVYRFDYYTPALERLGLYACHTADLLPLFELREDPFRQFYLGSEDEVRAIGKRMRAYWGAFARTGSPNAGGLTEWKPYSESERNTLLIDRQDKLEIDAEKNIRDRYEGYERILI